jgi:hypothetical protein
MLRKDIKYLRDERIAPLDVPNINGVYYHDLAPNTLDLAERAELALHVLTENPDPKWDYEIYDFTHFWHNPPFMFHDWNDYVAEQWKFFEALPLLRMITGSDRNQQVDKAWLEIVLRSIGPDGLFYVPMIGRPWARMNHYWGTTVWRADGSSTHIEDESVEFAANPFVTGRILSALTYYYAIDEDPGWKELIEKMIDRSLETLTDQGDEGYIPLTHFEPNAKVSLSAPKPLGMHALEMYARLNQAPAEYYQLTGYEPAKILSGKINNAVRHDETNFDAKGRFTLDEKGYEREHGHGPHFHSHAIVLLGMLDYAIATDNEGLKQFVKKSFEWGRAQGCSTVGFFPEWVGTDCKTAEICQVADMIALAVKLSTSGIGDYWDDLDRWVRNQFAESQMTKIDGILEAAMTLDKKPVSMKEVQFTNRGPYEEIPAEAVCYDRVIERNLGSFAGWPSANDWFNPEVGPQGIMHCCTPNAARSLYYLWKNMLVFKDGELTLHLLLNRAAVCADVYSYLPYDGQTILKTKKPCDKIMIRMPEWLAEGAVGIVCTVNAEPRPFTWKERYINIGAAKAGDQIRITFPIETRTVKEKIAGDEYTLVIRGNSVVSIDPPGKHYPLYQNEQYLNKNAMSWRPVRRFITETLYEC